VTVLAHGVGTRTDLPIPVGVAVGAAALAVLVSFAALGLLWRTPRLGEGAAGRPLPGWLARVCDSRVTTGVLRVVALLLALVVVGVALVGPQDPPRNLGVYAFYVTFWVGLVPASLLLGPVWARVNPLRTVHAVLARLTGPAPGADGVDRLGYWPGVAALLAYAWLELAYPGRSSPRAVGVFLVGYAVVQLVAALWYGERWFTRGDGFEVYSSLLGRLAPFGRRDDGRLVLRSPLDGVAALPTAPGLTAVVLVLIGSTAFDGLTRTSYWQSGPGVAGEGAALNATAGLLLTIGVVGLFYVAATGIGGEIASVADSPGRFAHSLVPIAAGYAVAHYFSLLLLDGQLTWILASDPLQQGRLDLFGTAANAVDYTAVSPRTISVVQVGAIIVGHVLGVVLAHDRAVRLARSRDVMASQVPLVLVMIGLTVLGLRLLLG